MKLIFNRKCLSYKTSQSQQLIFMSHCSQPTKTYPNSDMIVNITTDKQSNIKLHLYYGMRLIGHTLCIALIIQTAFQEEVKKVLYIVSDATLLYKLFNNQ